MTATATRPLRDIVIPANEPPARKDVDALTPNKTPKNGAVPQPPKDTRLPVWSMKKGPVRSDAEEALFPERVPQADEFWRWLLETRSTTAERAVRGYSFITTNARATGDDLMLYRRLLAWVAWCDTALWLLTHWYEGDNALPKPVSLVMPFMGHATAGGNPIRLVRELTGQSDELLLEEALNVWRGESLNGPTAYLHDVDLPTGPTELDTAAQSGGTR